MVISDYATSTDQALMVPIQINIDRIQPEFLPWNTVHAVGHVWGHPVDELLAPLASSGACGATSSLHRTGQRPPAEQIDAGGEEEEEGHKAGDGQRLSAPATTILEPPGDGQAAPLPKTQALRRREVQGDRATVAIDEDAVNEGGDRGFDIVIMADLLFNRSQHAQLLESCDRCLAKSEAATVWVSFSHHDPEKAKLDMEFFSLARLKGFVPTRRKTVSRFTRGQVFCSTTIARKAHKLRPGELYRTVGTALCSAQCPTIRQLADQHLFGDVYDHPHDAGVDDSCRAIQICDLVFPYENMNLLGAVDYSELLQQLYYCDCCVFIAYLPLLLDLSRDWLVAILSRSR